MPATTTISYNATTEVTPSDSTATLRVVLAIITTSIIMVGMGCAIEVKKLVEKFKRPIGLLIGMLCQWVIMPSLAYGFTRAFSLPGPETLSILIMGSCPGGVTSNVVTYYILGDMNLSIAMTGTSVLLSLGLIPLLLFLYSKSFSSIGEDLQVPYSSLGISVATLIIPLSIGICIRWKFPKRAKLILKIGAIIGAVAAVGGGIAAIFFYSGQWSILSGQIIAAVFLPPIGMGLSYGIASLFSLIKRIRLNHKQRRTISIETGIQNAQIALGIIQLSGWSVTIGAKMILVPLAYVLSQIFWAALGVGAYYLYRQKKGVGTQATDETTRPQTSEPTHDMAVIGGNRELAENYRGIVNPRFDADNESINSRVVTIRSKEHAHMRVSSEQQVFNDKATSVEREDEGGFCNPTYTAIEDEKTF